MITIAKAEGYDLWKGNNPRAKAEGYPGEIIPEKLKDYDEMLLDNPIWQGRLKNVGILTTEECFAYGITGPSLRASGFSWDLQYGYDLDARFVRLHCECSESKSWHESDPKSSIGGMI